MSRTGLLSLGCLLGALIAFGCASVSVAHFDEAPARPRECKLDLYQSKDEIKRPFETVCVIGVHTGTSIFAHKGIGGALEKAKPKACECGADAMVIMSASEGGMWTSGQGKAEVRAIRYTDSTEVEPGHGTDSTEWRR